MTKLSNKYFNGENLGSVIVRSIIGSAGVRLAGMIFSFLVGVQLARGLGIEGYGIYGLTMSVIALLAIPTEFGLPQLLTREIAAAEVTKDWPRMSGVLKWSNKVVLLTSTFITILAFTSLIFIENNLKSSFSMTLYAGLVMIPMIALGKLRSATLRGLQHVVKGQIPDTLVRPALFSLFLFFFSLTTKSLSPELAMFLGATSSAVTFYFSATMLCRHLPAELRTSKPEINQHIWLSSAIPMALTEGMRILQNHAAILLIGVIGTTTMVALFKIASSVSILIATPITLLNIVCAPILARLHAQNEHAKSQKILRWISIAMTSSSILLTIPFLLAGQPLLSEVFGNDFGSSNYILIILCGSITIDSFFGANATLLNMTGNHIYVTRASTASLTLLTITTPILVNIYGAIGAAIANLTSMLTWNIIMWNSANKILKLDTSFLHLFYIRKHHD